MRKLVFAKPEMKRLYAPIVDTKEYKQNFLRGQPYNITHYVELKDPISTSYQDTMHGLPPNDKAKVVDFERLSCGIGGVIPDPFGLTKNSNRM